MKGPECSGMMLKLLQEDLDSRILLSGWVSFLHGVFDKYEVAKYIASLDSAKCFSVTYFARI